MTNLNVEDILSSISDVRCSLDSYEQELIDARQNIERAESHLSDARTSLKELEQAVDEVLSEDSLTRLKESL